MSDLLVPDAFRAMPRWWSDASGRAWLDDLPGLVREQRARWDLEVDGPSRHGSNALVVPVRRGHARFALRLAPPGDDVARAARDLRLLAGRGTVLLHGVDERRRAMLLERLDPTRTLAQVPLPAAIGELGRIARRLAVPVPTDVPSTAAEAAALLIGLDERWAAAGRPASDRVLAAVRAAAEDRAAAPQGTGAVDGDLHFDQVLAGGRTAWTVVDPLLLRGDPEFDVGRVLWSRLDEVPGDDDVRAMLDLFVHEADVPAERARRWVLVRATSYLLWGLEHGLTEDPPRCLRLLRVFA